MADDGVDIDRVSSLVIAMLRAPTWVSPIANFIDENCMVFEDLEENKLEYTMVHNAFTTLVDELLAAHLSEFSVTTEEFLLFSQRGLTGNNEVHRTLVEQLISVDDFLVFKAMMVKRSADLRRETLAAHAEDARAREEAEQLEALRLEAERLDVERRCLEAELQLMVALSMQLEQRLQLTVALNELVEAVSKMEALAAEAAEEPAAAAASAAAVAAAQAPSAALPPTVHVQPLRAEGPPPAAPAPAPAPKPALAPPVAAGPSEAERQARAEHLKRQREALVAKKKREREAELAAFNQTQGPSAASRAAERAIARTGTASVQSPAGQDAEAGKRLAAELSGALAQPAPVLPDPEAAAIQMRKTIARQLKQSLTQPTF